MYTYTQRELPMPGLNYALPELCHVMSRGSVCNSRVKLCYVYVLSWG